MEQQLPAGLGERQIAQFVKDDEVEAGQIVGQPSLTAGAGFTLQPVDQIDDGVEAATGATADASPGDGDGEMALAGAGRTNTIVPDIKGRRRRSTTRFIPAVASRSVLSVVTVSVE